MRRAAALAILALAAAACAARSPAQGPSSSPSAPAASATASGPRVPRLTVTPEEVLPIVLALRDLHQSAGRASFDVRAQAAALGADASAAFAFVRDQVATDIYPGALRAARGTLAARAGNAADKALLLGALLEAQGRVVRYAQCTLGESRGRERLAALFMGRTVGGAALHEALREALVRHGLPEGRAGEVAETWREIRAAMEATVTRTAEADLATVREALQAAGLRPRPALDQETLLQEARAHYWVQVEEGGNWRDLDPNFPAAQPGQAFCTPERVGATFPEEGRQVVAIRIRNEYAVGGTLSQETVLEHRVAAADLHGVTIHFLNAPEPSDALDRGDASSANRFISVLRIGERVVVGREFELVRRPAPSGAGGLLGQSAGQTAGSGATPPHLVAQWLDLEFVAPGRSARASRPVIDTVPPPERAQGAVRTLPEPTAVALQLMQPHAIAVSTGRLDPLQALEEAYREAEPQALARLFGLDLSADLPDGAEADIASLVLPSLTARALALAHASDRALATASGGPVRLFRDQPLVVIVNRTLRRLPDRRTALVGVSTDIRHNPVRAAYQGAAEEAFWSVVRHGLVDGALERHLAAYVWLRRAQHDPLGGETEAFSTSRLVQLAREAGISVRAVAEEAAVAWLREAAPAGTGYRLAGEVGDRTAVVAPAQSIEVGGERRFGMWTVDLQSGQTVALLESGLRQAMTEYERTKRDVNFFWTAWRNCTLKGYRHCDLLWRWYREALRRQVDYELALPAHEWKTVMYFFGAL